MSIEKNNQIISLQYSKSNWMQLISLNSYSYVEGVNKTLKPFMMTALQIRANIHKPFARIIILIIVRSSRFIDQNFFSTCQIEYLIIISKCIARFLARTIIKMKTQFYSAIISIKSRDIEFYRIHKCGCKISCI